MNQIEFKVVCSKCSYSYNELPGRGRGINNEITETINCLNCKAVSCVKINDSEGNDKSEIPFENLLCPKCNSKNIVKWDGKCIKCNGGMKLVPCSEY